MKILFILLLKNGFEVKSLSNLAQLKLSCFWSINICLFLNIFVNEFIFKALGGPSLPKPQLPAHLMSMELCEF
jgi:hypothetical protein